MNTLIEARNNSTSTWQIKTCCKCWRKQISYRVSSAVPTSVLFGIKVRWRLRKLLLYKFVIKAGTMILCYSSLLIYSNTYALELICSFFNIKPNLNIKGTYELIMFSELWLFESC